MGAPFAFFAALIFAGTSASCGSSTQVCASGTSIGCTCPDGAKGAQTCATDGHGFGTCKCGSGSGGGSTTSSTTAGPTSSSSGPTSSSTGVPGTCATKVDCKALDDACHQGSCVDGMCTQAPANDGATCDDGVFCTTNDECYLGKCVGGAAMDCPGTDACHVGYCDSVKKACAQSPGNDGAPCNPLNICATAGACTSGNCSPTGVVDCSKFNSACTTGVCDPQSGCKPMPANPGGVCDDGLYCTDNDACSNGVCAGKPKTCAPAGSSCMTSVCNEAAKSCAAMPANDGSACSSGNLCVGSETCASGKCVGGQPANAGGACDDGNTCTASDKCQSGACKGTAIVACVGGDGCCPAGCTGLNDSDCLYWKSGVQQNINAAALSGWTQCYQDTYITGAALAFVLQACSKPKLLMACGPTGTPTFTILAMGLRTDVLFECGNTANCTHVANGVGWYFDNNWSWGFAPGGDAVNRNTCDFDVGAVADPGSRLCWQTNGGALSPGWRCGATQNLSNNSNWQRVVYQAD